MFIYSWGSVFTASLFDLWQGFIEFVPSLLLAIIIFVIGWVLASFLGRIVSKIIDAVKFDHALSSLGAKETIERSGFQLNAGRFIGGIVKWFVIIVFLITSLEILGLTEVNDFLRGILSYLPRVIVAALVLFAASAIARAIEKAVEGGGRALGAGSSRAAASIAKWAVWIFALLIALSELGVAPIFMQTLFTGIIAMLAIAGGIAFGMGGKDAAQKTIEHMKDKLTK